MEGTKDGRIKIYIANIECLEEDAEYFEFKDIEVEIQTLPKKYFYVPSTDKFFQVKLATTNKSVFIDNTVQEKGDIYIITPLHPLFILVGLLYIDKNKATTFDQILTEPRPEYFGIEENTLPEFETRQIMSKSISMEKALKRVCNVEYSELVESNVYQLNEDKLMEFLKARFDGILKKVIAIESRGIQEVEHSQFRKTYLALAMGFLASEIPLFIAEAFHKRFIENEAEMSFEAFMNYGLTKKTDARSSKEAGIQNDVQPHQIPKTEKKIKEDKNSKKITDFFNKK